MSERTSTVTKRGVAKNLVVVAIFLIFTLVVGVAFAYFGGTSTPGGNGAAAATSVAAGATPTLTSPNDSTVTVSWVASTLGTGQAVTGYVVKRYEATTLAIQTILTACTGTIATVTCTESNLPTGSWRYSVTPKFATNWLGAESDKSLPISTIEKDVTPPVNVLTSTVVTGKSFKNQNTIYYLGSAAGSFTVTNALTDAASGPASSTTQALTGTSTGWTHTGSKVSTPEDGPYVSNSFSWVAGTTTTPAEAVVGRDVQENTASTTLTFTNDITGPVAAVSYLNGYEAGRSTAVTFSSSDAGSGVGPSSVAARIGPSHQCHGGLRHLHQLFPGRTTEPHLGLHRQPGGQCDLLQVPLRRHRSTGQPDHRHQQQCGQGRLSGGDRRDRRPAQPVAARRVVRRDRHLRRHGRRVADVSQR